MNEKISKRIFLLSQKSKVKEKESVQTDDDRYWSVKDIAEYTGLSVYTIRRNFLVDPRWPIPLVSSRGIRNSSRRWLASEVKQALLLFREG